MRSLICFHCETDTGRPWVRIVTLRDGDTRARFSYVSISLGFRLMGAMIARYGRSGQIGKVFFVNGGAK